jgi:predicted dehydrogenase
MSLKFGLVGLGFHGSKAVAPSFYHRDAECVELAAVCDISAAALDAFQQPVSGKFTDHRTMLADGGVDALYVAAGMDRHHGIVMDAIAAGKHVVVEKPMAATLEQCREMTAAAQAAGVVLAVNFETRYSEQNEVLRRWITAGHFGRINALHFANLWDGHKSFGPVKERRARLMELAGALDCGIHKLDQARFLVGGTWTRVDAVGAWMGEDFTPPTHIGIIGMLDVGVMVTLNASLSWAAHIEPRPMVNTLEIAGTCGVALCRSSPDFLRMTMNLYSENLCEEVELESSGHTSDIVLLLQDFVQVVDQGAGPDSRLATGEDGYWAQFATETANRRAIAAR